jgi:hypothetical protein
MDPVLEIKKQIVYCMHQILRLTKLLTESNHDNNIVLQYGYYSGRMNGMFEKIDPRKKEIDKIACLKSVRLGVNGSHDEDIIDFGYAIGYLQELCNGSPDIWLKQIIGESWATITQITQDNVEKAFGKVNNTVDWRELRKITESDASKYKIPPPSEAFMNQL